MSSPSPDPAGRIRYDTAAFDQMLNAVTDAVLRHHGISLVFVTPNRRQRTEGLMAFLEAGSLNLYQYEATNLLANRFVDTMANLREAFDRVDDDGALLYFDEGDVLFGSAQGNEEEKEQAGALTPADYVFQRADAFGGAFILALADEQHVERAADYGFDYIVEF